MLDWNHLGDANSGSECFYLIWAFFKINFLCRSFSAIQLQKMDIGQFHPTSTLTHVIINVGERKVLIAESQKQNTVFILKNALKLVQWYLFLVSHKKGHKYRRYILLISFGKINFRNLQQKNIIKRPYCNWIQKDQKLILQLLLRKARTIMFYWPW